jgi:hypothetical protein
VDVPSTVPVNNVEVIFVKLVPIPLLILATPSVIVGAVSVLLAANVTFSLNSVGLLTIKEPAELSVSRTLVALLFICK